MLSNRPRSLNLESPTSKIFIDELEYKLQAVLTAFSA